MQLYIVFNCVQESSIRIMVYKKWKSFWDTLIYDVRPKSIKPEVVFAKISNWTLIIF